LLEKLGQDGDLMLGEGFTHFLNDAIPLGIGCLQRALLSSRLPIGNRSLVVLSNLGQLFNQIAEDLLLTAGFSEHTFANVVGQWPVGVAGATCKQAYFCSAELHAD